MTDFWLSIMNNLKSRGLDDILIAVVDGLNGFPDAINAAFPDTTVQTRIVHRVRHSLNFSGWKDCKAVANEEAAKVLDDFAAASRATEHLHSALRFVAPNTQHAGLARDLLNKCASSMQMPVRPIRHAGHGKRATGSQSALSG